MNIYSDWSKGARAASRRRVSHAKRVRCSQHVKAVSKRVALSSRSVRMDLRNFCRQLDMLNQKHLHQQAVFWD